MSAASSKRSIFPETLTLLLHRMAGQPEPGVPAGASTLQHLKTGTGYNMAREINGGCLCGAVTYKTSGTLRSIVACHCHQCRKTSGHYVAATQVDFKSLQIFQKSLTWFQSSAKAERGFCSICDSNLFWRAIGSPHISIFAGTIDGPTGLKMERQLYAESAGDYYDVPAITVIDQRTLD